MSRRVEPLPGMIGWHPSMLEVARRVRAAARSDVPVTVIGESGTGKELVARALHELSPVAGGPFVAVNCAALPESLAEAELFGAERGAYTGAFHPRPGFLERADGGTLFLDEACSMPTAVQAKLLRAVELREFFRVGGTRQRRATFRVVTALSEPLEQLIQSRRVRRDFAYRIASVRITLPALRERTSDIADLASHFLVASNGAHPRTLSAGAMRLLERHRWPGNVRELRSVIQSAALLSDHEVLDTDDVTDVLDTDGSSTPHPHQLHSLLEANAWNVTSTAQWLGVARSTLYVWLAKYGIRRPRNGNGAPSDRSDKVSDRTVPL